MSAQDGGPAFPDNLHEGMSLRDWFAGQALVSMGMWIPAQGLDTVIGVYDQNDIRRLRAEYAYAQADAMLAARIKP